MQGTQTLVDFVNTNCFVHSTRWRSVDMVLVTWLSSALISECTWLDPYSPDEAWAIAIKLYVFPLFIYLFVFCILRHFHCAHRLVPPNSIHRHSFIPRGMTVGILPRGQHPLSQLNNWVSPLCVNKNRNRKCERMLSLCVTMMIVIFPCRTNVCQQMTEGL